MSNAVAIYGTAFKAGSVTNLARIVGYNGEQVEPSDIGSIIYTIRAVGHGCEPVPGHAARPLVVGDVLFDAPRTDATWTVDEVGYNFRHIVDVRSNAAFPQAGSYLIEYTLTPAVGQPIVVQFAIKVI